MRNILITAILAAGMLPSHAYSNWFEKGLEVLQGSHSSTESSDNSNSAINFSNHELESAFREALSIGSEKVIDKIGLKDGFNKDPKIHIPLPSSLNTIKSGLGKVGMESYMNELETTLNRAAEEAMPETKKIFLNAIASMTFEDVKAIYQGSDNAATRYLKKATTPELKQKISPIIDAKLNQVGAVNAYDSLTQQYRQQYPFLPNIKSDLQGHVMDKALEGMFLYLGQEETKIRQEPMKYGSDLLKKVFSN